MTDQLTGLDALAGRRLWLSGGRGFIGSRVVRLASAAGATVTLLEGDVRERESVRAQIASARPELLIHLAAPVSVARDPSLAPQMDEVIVGGARTVTEAARRLGDVQLVLVGTCEEYGTIEAPFAEGDVPSAPVSPYAAAKLTATREALRSASDFPGRLVVARPFLTYGPGQRPRQLIPALIEAALDGRRFPMTAGTQTREVNYVDDIARGLLRAALVPEAHGRVVNIGGGEELTVAELARVVTEAAGGDPSLLEVGALPTRSGEVPRFCSDPTLCRTLLGHRPLVSLADGLARTVAAARARRRAPEESPLSHEGPGS